MIAEIRSEFNAFLPAGCPFVIGGGLIRDAIMGGRPGDIDIWMPANMNRGALNDFVNHINAEWGPRALNAVFTGPGANEGAMGVPSGVPVLTGETESDYGDVNNHWVCEMDIGDHWPKINIMRSMTSWNNNAQEYFNGLMRAFDIDIYMMFCAWMPGDRTEQRTVIMPAHLVSMWTNTPMAMENYRFRMNDLHYNASRVNTTSQERLQSRIDKMCNKYRYVWTTTANVRVIPMEAIQAVPVTFSKIIGAVNRIRTMIPLPTDANAQQEPTNGTAGQVLPTQGQRFNWN